MRLSGTSVNFLVTLVVVGLGLLTSVLLARLLNADGRGELAATLLWPMILPYLGMTGPLNAFVYYASRFRGDITKVVGNSLLLGGLVSVLLIGFGYSLLPLLLSNQSSEVILAARIMLLGIPATIAGEIYSSLLRSHMKIPAFNIQRVISPFGYLVGTVFLQQFGSLTLLNLVVLNLTLNCCRLLASVILCKMTGIDLGLDFDRALSKQMLRFGAKSHPGALGEHANSYLDQALIAAWLAPAQLGFYVAAVSTTTIVKTVSQTLKIVILPLIAGESCINRQNELLVRVFRAFWTLSVMGAPIFALSLYWLIPFVYGPGFSGAVVPAIILVFGAVMYGAKDILSTGANAFGEPWLVSKAELATLVVTAILLALTLPTIGIIGAGATAVVSSGIALAIMIQGITNNRDIGVMELLTPERDLRRLFSSLIKRKAAVG